MWLTASTGTDYVIYGMAVMALVYIVMRPLMRRRKDPLDSPFHLSLAQQRAVEKEMNSALVELADMARQITAQLDTRAAKLSALLDDADRRIQQLQSLTRQSPLSMSEPHQAPSVTEDAPIQTPNAEPEDERHREVHELADQGLSPAEVAARLGRPRGEVELILALRRRG